MPIESLKCPLCSSIMVSRVNNGTGQHFWGCPKYPHCKGTRNTDGEASTHIKERREAREEEEPMRELPSDSWRHRDRRRW